MGWTSSLALPQVDGRDHVFVVADHPLREAIATAARDSGFHVLACKTALDGIQLLERLGSRIAYAILSTAHRSFEMRSLLADEYPAIRQIALVG